MPVASAEKDGLASRNSIRYVGNIGPNDLKDVGTCIGYSYATEDGSDMIGSFLSIVPPGVSGFQIKISHLGTLKYRAYNALEKVWSNWKAVSLT